MFELSREESTKHLNIAVIGYGVVGSGVVELILNNHYPACLKKVVVRDLEKYKAKLPEGMLTDNLELVLKDKNIDLVIDCTSGVNDIMIKTLDAGKHIVTANKISLVKYWTQIFTHKNVRR